MFAFFFCSALIHLTQMTFYSLCHRRWAQEAPPEKQKATHGSGGVFKLSLKPKQCSYLYSSVAGLGIYIPLRSSGLNLTLTWSAIESTLIFAGFPNPFWPIRPRIRHMKKTETTQKERNCFSGFQTEDDRCARLELPSELRQHAGQERLDERDRGAMPSSAQVWRRSRDGEGPCQF